MMSTSPQKAIASRLYTPCPLVRGCCCCCCCCWFEFCELTFPFRSGSNAVFRVKERALVSVQAIAACPLSGDQHLQRVAQEVIARGKDVSGEVLMVDGLQVRVKLDTIPAICVWAHGALNEVRRPNGL